MMVLEAVLEGNGDIHIFPPILMVIQNEISIIA